MWLFYLSLCLGIIIGVTNLIPAKILKHNDLLMMVCVFILLFVMGLSIGLKKDIIKNFGYIGITGVLYSIICVIFSIIVVYLFTSLKKRGDK
ncbi:MAG: LysO family transporter [Bacilli bacterium]|nr:LysO family transporter [Bacilli bacterium]